MSSVKYLGIWMDHSRAHLMDFPNSPIGTKIIESEFTREAKEHSLSKSENLMHNKEQNEQSKYYKKLKDIIINYDDVILFGPTNAKVELYNDLIADYRFAKVKIKFKQADKMTENQQLAYVRDYFSIVA